MRAYGHAGGVHGAVARLAERAYERLDPERARRAPDPAAARGRRATIRRARRCRWTSSTARAREVLAVLADERLVTIGEGEVEVAHEALLREWPRLRGWLEEDAQGRRAAPAPARRRARLGGRRPRPGRALPRRAARRGAGVVGRACRRAQRDRARVRRREPRREPALAAPAAGAVRRPRRAARAGVVAGVVALEQRGDARAEATAAEAQRLGARALVEDDLDLSLLLARQGVALDDSPQTRGNLLAALLKSPAAIGVLRGDGDRVSPWT